MHVFFIFFINNIKYCTLVKFPEVEVEGRDVTTSPVIMRPTTTIIYTEESENIDTPIA